MQTPNTIDQLEQFAAQYTQLRKDAEAAGIEWRTVVAKADGGRKSKPATVAGQQYTIRATMPDGTVIESAQRFPYAFCIAVWNGSAWRVKYHNMKEFDAKKSAIAAEQAGAHKVAVIPAEVVGQTAAAPKPAPTSSEPVANGRETSALRKLHARLLAMETAQDDATLAQDTPIAPEVVESLAAANAIATQIRDYTEELPQILQAEPDTDVQAEEITREPVEEEQEYQNVKIVGGTAVHALDDEGERTLCGITDRDFVQTDAALTCKSCAKKLAKA